MPDVLPVSSTDTPVDALGSMSDDQRIEWLKSGTPSWKQDGPAEPLSPADSTPAEPAEQAALTDASPETASEPVTPKKQKAKGADASVEELLADRKRERERADRLEREIADLRGQSPKAEAPAASSPALQPRSLDDIVRKPDINTPILGDDEFFKQFPDASYGQYTRYAANYDRATDAAEQQRTGQVQTQIEKHLQAMAKADAELLAYGKTDTTFFERLKASELGLMQPANQALYEAWKAGKPKPRLSVDHHIAQELVDSEQTAEIVNHLLGHDDDLAFLRAASDEFDLHRRFGRLEGRLERAAAEPAHTKPVTKAPSPGTYLGTNAGTPADVLKTYTANGDAGSYIDEANRREMERFGKRR